MPLKDGNLEGAKQLFRLILVDFHRVILSGGLKVTSDVEVGVARRIRAFATWGLIIGATSESVKAYSGFWEI
jgi:hypothetical protein